MTFKNCGSLPPVVSLGMLCWLGIRKSYCFKEAEEELLELIQSSLLCTPQVLYLILFDQEVQQFVLDITLPLLNELLLPMMLWWYNPPRISMDVQEEWIFFCCYHLCYYPSSEWQAQCLFSRSVVFCSGFLCVFFRVLSEKVKGPASDVSFQYSFKNTCFWKIWKRGCRKMSKVLAQ